jgi:hypothetical protein
MEITEIVKTMENMKCCGNCKYWTVDDPLCEDIDEAYCCCDKWIHDGLTREMRHIDETHHHHIFDGQVWYSADGRTGSVTCSICGMPEIFWDEKNLI